MEELKETFEVFDTDNDGLIQADDLKTIFHEIGDDVSIEDCETMINAHCT